jgi:DNA-binding PucR family transcriptional regulator
VSYPHRLLELLAADASWEQLEQAARQVGVSETDDQVRKMAELAHRVRTTLDQQRRRETELAALVDTARDLAGLRDLDAVLVAIVRRARRLLGTDIAYLTLADPDRGDTYMRVTDGSVSARFQRLRLPMGAGLGGLVAQTGAPYATADYLHDTRFRHTREIDTGVLEEGLVAILGVPLAQRDQAQGGRVIGVLFAANRRSRPFTPDEVDLLSSLGALAAVAIDNARLLAETRQAVEEARAANELARQRSAQVERAADAHERMTALVLRGGDIPELAAAVVDVLSGGLLVLDADRRVLATIGVEPGGACEAALEDAFAAARRSAGSVEVPDSPLGPCRVAAALGGGEALGYLLLHGRDALDDGERRILERAAQVTALLLLLRTARVEAESRVRGELLTDLLDAPDRDPGRLRQRALRLPLDLDAPYLVVAAAGEGVGRHRLASAAAALASERHGLAGEYQGVVVLLLPAQSNGANAGAAARLASSRLATAVRAPITAGGAGPAAGPSGIAAAYRQARRCLDALHALGRAGQAASAEDLGFAGLLLSQLHSEQVARFVDDTIGPLLRYDARRGTELVATVSAYFAHDRSPARCAGPLHVHVNTVAQRLDRVRALLGEDWVEPQRALQIQLALHLHRLRGGLAA